MVGGMWIFLHFHSFSSIFFLLLAYSRFPLIFSWFLVVFLHLSLCWVFFYSSFFSFFFFFFFFSFFHLFFFFKVIFVFFLVCVSCFFFFFFSVLLSFYCFFLVSVQLSVRLDRFSGVFFIEHR